MKKKSVAYTMSAKWQTTKDSEKEKKDSIEYYQNQANFLKSAIIYHTDAVKYNKMMLKRTELVLDTLNKTETKTYSWEDKK